MDSIQNISLRALGRYFGRSPSTESLLNEEHDKCDDDNGNTVEIGDEAFGPAEIRHDVSVQTRQLVEKRNGQKEESREGSTPFGPRLLGGDSRGRNFGIGRGGGGGRGLVSQGLTTRDVKRDILLRYGSMTVATKIAPRRVETTARHADEKEKNSSCPLFEEENRTSLFPIKYVDVWEMYKKAVASFWTVDEIDMSGDAIDWGKLKEDERAYVTRVLIFFLGADRLVNDNLLERFTKDVKMFECLYFYQFQMAMENVHTETYNILIETFVTDEHEREALFKSVEGYASIAKKYDWCRRWTGGGDDDIDEDIDTYPPPSSFAHRLVAFACVEGIFFSSSFAAIFWLKSRGLLRGLCFSNELISRDEGLHCDFAVLLFKNYCPPIPVQDVRTIVSESCEIEKTFVRESMESRDLIGIDCASMCAYVDFISERLMMDLTGERLRPETPPPVNPLTFMETITLQGKTNFFERKVSEYRVAGAKIH